MDDTGLVTLPSGRVYARAGAPLSNDPHAVRFLEACNAFVSRDEATNLTKERAIVLADRAEPVLIQGESGTGKDLLARILHGKLKGQYVPVNVCAVAETLFESELFGHVKGSFTGAHQDRTGLIRQADNGTLFLDEIGDMPLTIQAKMLRVIHNRTFRRVGSNEEEPVKCRVVAATHRNLRDMIAKGTFRLDLYERLQVFRLHIRPLRERLQDMELYVGSKFMVDCAYMRNHRDKLHFSGNVRQLLNMKLRCEVFGQCVLTEEDIM